MSTQSIRFRLAHGEVIWLNPQQVVAVYIGHSGVTIRTSIPPYGHSFEVYGTLDDVVERLMS
jgi:hypothetical protein